METFNWDVLNESVHLLSSVLIVVSSSRNSNANSGWKVSDTLRPDELVEVGVNSDILSQHNLLNEISNSADGCGSSLLERLVQSQLGEMNCQIAGDWLETLLGTFSCLGHGYGWSTTTRDD